jgi:hypothetical protein
MECFTNTQHYRDPIALNQPTSINKNTHEPIQLGIYSTLPLCSTLVVSWWSYFLNLKPLLTSSPYGLPLWKCETYRTVLISTQGDKWPNKTANKSRLVNLSFGDIICLRYPIADTINHKENEAFNGKIVWIKKSRRTSQKYKASNSNKNNISV